MDEALLLAILAVVVVLCPLLLAKVALRLLSELTMQFTLARQMPVAPAVPAVARQVRVVQVGAAPAPPAVPRPHSRRVRGRQRGLSGGT
jgi:Na+-transporting methylmalonyl-CoA/oxaloacetate decarboxylase gamma subunit